MKRSLLVLLEGSLCVEGSLCLEESWLPLLKRTVCTKGFLDRPEVEGPLCDVEISRMCLEGLVCEQSSCVVSALLVGPTLFTVFLLKRSPKLERFLLNRSILLREEDAFWMVEVLPPEGSLLVGQRYSCE